MRALEGSGRKAGPLFLGVPGMPRVWSESLQRTEVAPNRIAEGEDARREAGSEGSRRRIAAATNRNRIEGPGLWREPDKYGEVRNAKETGLPWEASGPVRLIRTTASAMALDGHGGVSRRQSTGPGRARKGGTSWCGETDRRIRWAWGCGKA